MSRQFYFRTQGDLPFEKALANLTSLAILAHPDDGEIGCPHAISEGLKSEDKNFGLIIVTNGEGAPRSGENVDLSNEELAKIRLDEQADAANEGKYHFLGMLQHPDLADVSLDVEEISAELLAMLKECRNLKEIYTHNPFDYHPGHLSVLAATLSALGDLDKEQVARIEKFAGVEIWGEIGFMSGPTPEQRSPNLIQQPLSKEEAELQLALIFKHQSQVRENDYCAAFRGRQGSRHILENPFSSSDGDQLALSVDMSPMIGENAVTLQGFIDSEILAYSQRVAERTQTYASALQSKSPSRQQSISASPFLFSTNGIRISSEPI